MQKKLRPPAPAERSLQLSMPIGNLAASRRVAMESTVSRRTYLSGPVLRALAPLLACAAILLSAASARAMICPLPETIEDEALASFLPDPPSTPAAVGAEFRAATASKGQSCNRLSSEECQLRWPEGQPEPPARISLHKPVAAHWLSTSQSASSHGTGLRFADRSGAECSGYLARLFRPPRDA